MNNYKDNIIIDLINTKIAVDHVEKKSENVFLTTCNGLVAEHTLHKSDQAILIKTEITNATTEDILPGNYPLLGILQMTSPVTYDKVHIVCKDMLGFCGPQVFDKEWSSYGVCGLTDNAGTHAVTFGFSDVSDYFFNFTVMKEDATISITPYMPFEHSSIKAGQKVTVQDFKISWGSSLTDLLTNFGYTLAENMRNTPYEFKKTPSGFCSWYYYYGTESQDDIKALVSEYANSPVKDKLDYFLIDGGWNEDIGDEQFNWGDWHAKSKFSQGMKHISDYIHQHGFRSGLWIAPFAITKNSTIFRDHPDWVVGKGEDLLNNGGETYGLDLTHPEVKVYLRDNITKIFDEWGFDYIKIDFLLYGALAGERYDNQKTSAMAFREGLKIIRECAGNRLVLNCGSPLFQSTGYCDALRIGPDVGSRWYFPLNYYVWQYGNCCVKAGMRYIIYNQWMNRVLWYNDPDCLVARSKSNGVEFEQFKKFFPNMDIDESCFGLTKNEFLAFAKLIWFTQGFYFLSDKWLELEEDRKEILTRFAEPHSQEVALVDYYEHYDISIFKTKSGKLKVGVFNIGDTVETVKLPASKLGLYKWEFVEITENICFKCEGDIIEFPEVPAHSGYIFELR